MKPDLSKTLYEKFCHRSICKIEVTLKSGRKIRGIFISYIYGEPNRHDPFIRKWHIVEEKDQVTQGMDNFGFQIGELIDQISIKQITFLDDYSTMEFE